MRGVLFVAAAALVLCASAQSLGKYVIADDEITVSGISAGAFMAVQLHVAYSAAIRGSASIAGGAYYCAQGSLTTALTACMTSPGQVNVATLQRAAEAYAAGGDIDPLGNLARGRVYIFAGTQDGTVAPDESRKLQDFLGRYINGTDPVDGRARIATEYGIAAGHAHITDSYGNTCARTAAPYINDCDYDQSGVLLQHMYRGKLNPRGTAVAANLLQFDQEEFPAISMDPVGFVYVPTACKAGAACRLHVALHGCLQYWRNAQIGTQYVENAGYNEWAETNNIIVLYPQAEPDYVRSNPNGCWDWWSYAGQDYATKTGSQMKTIFDMIQRVSSGAPAIEQPTGLRVTGTSDNTVGLAWNPVSGATRYEVERDDQRVTPPEGVTAPSFTDTGLASGTRYTYVVIALNNQGSASIKSDPVTATTTGTPPPLSAPVGLGAVEITSTEIFLAWTPVTNANFYTVNRDGVDVANVTSAGYDDLGLQAERAYTYRVRATNGFGSSPSSAPLTVTTESSWQCQEYRDNNYNHVQRGRAYQTAGLVYALGSDDYMGLYNVAVYTSLAETSEGYFVIGSC